MNTRIQVLRYACSVCRETFLICLLLGGLVTAHAQSYRLLITTADSLYEAKDFKNSLRIYEKAFVLQRNNGADLYNAACAAACALEKQKAYALLELALDHGWVNVRHLRQDPDLLPLHGEEPWGRLVDRMQKRLEEIESNYDRPLQAELLQILDEDQKPRMMIDSIQAKYGYDSKEMKDLFNSISRADSVNLGKVTAILDKRGWVGPDKVGSQASQTLFLVIQHSDLRTQERYLPMMKEAVSGGNASPGDLALLVDRIEMRNGRPQIYGSQVIRKDGRYVFYEILDEGNVNKRRKDVGLQPLEEYAKHWKIIYAPPTK